MISYIGDYYPEIHRVIKGYDEEAVLLRTDSVSIENYPKVFTLCSASVFETRIKKEIDLFLSHPASPITTTYPLMNVLLSHNGNKTVDKAFAKLKGYLDSNTGAEVLNATDFYDLFGSLSFRNAVENEYNNYLNFQQSYVATQAHNLEVVWLQSDGKYVEKEYSEMVYIRDTLKMCTFTSAEYDYLNIKLRRNKVAHNYMINTLDSFSDLRKFYYGASIYVYAVVQAIHNLVDISYQ